MSIGLQRLPCRYHAEAPALGVCMRCRSPICQGCRTRLRGINLCHRCLNRLARPVEAVEAGASGQWFMGMFLFIPAVVLIGLLLWWTGAPAAPSTEPGVDALPTKAAPPPAPPRPAPPRR